MEPACLPPPPSRPKEAFTRVRCNKSRENHLRSFTTHALATGRRKLLDKQRFHLKPRRSIRYFLLSLFSPELNISSLASQFQSQSIYKCCMRNAACQNIIMRGNSTVEYALLKQVCDDDSVKNSVGFDELFLFRILLCSTRSARLLPVIHHVRGRFTTLSL